MSNHRAIMAVTATLVQVLDSVVSAAVTGARALPTRPDGRGAPESSRGVHVFLYQVTPNVALRNADLALRNAAGAIVRRPLAALDLHYLLTFFGDEAAYEPQRMLGRVVGQLHTYPVLTQEMILAAQDEGSGPGPIDQVRLTELPLSLDELTRLWSVFFQTPYSLSVAYQATPVLIEGEELPEAALPVLRRGVYALPLRPPTIEQARVQTGAAAQPMLVIEGRGLRGPQTLVRLGGHDLEPAAAGSTRVTLNLAGHAAGTLRAGVQRVQIVHRLLIGEPPSPHTGVASNVAAFVLPPAIVLPSAASGICEVQVRPAVGREQRARLLLSRVIAAGEEPLSYSLPAEPFGVDARGAAPAESGSLRFDVAAVRSGVYLGSVQVDGASSPLVVDEDPQSPTYGQYAGPTIAITSP